MRHDQADMGAAVTLDEVAAALGVSKGRVRQLEVSGLAKCRRFAAAHGLTAGDLPGDGAHPDSISLEQTPWGS